MPATTTGTPFSLNVPSASTDTADLFGLYLKPNMSTINTYAAHKGTAQTFSALQTFSAGLTVSAGTLTAAAGVTVSSGGAAITGTLAVTGAITATTSIASTTTMTAGTGLTVTSGGATITAGGLTITAGGATVNAGGVILANNTALQVKNTSGTAINAVVIDGSNQLVLGNASIGGATYVNGGTGQAIYLAPNATNQHIFQSNGYVGIGQTSAGSALDVKGTLRLSGSTSGYVGFAPAAAAGSTTYTLPSSDGSAGQLLSTNGAGTLSWATSSGGGGGARALLLMGA